MLLPLFACLELSSLSSLCLSLSCHSTKNLHRSIFSTIKLQSCLQKKNMQQNGPLGEVDRRKMNTSIFIHLIILHSPPSYLLLLTIHHFSFFCNLPTISFVPASRLTAT